MEYIDQYIDVTSQFNIKWGSAEIYSSFSLCQ